MRFKNFGDIFWRPYTILSYIDILSPEICCRSDWTLGAMASNTTGSASVAARQVTDSEWGLLSMLAISQRQRRLALDGVQERTAIKAGRGEQRPVDYILAVGKPAI